MKMFKRITATLVLVLSLCTIAWGESKYEKAVKCIQNNIKSLEIVGENEKTYDRLFHEENKLKTDDKLWCYTGKSDEKILLGHIPGNKDLKVGKNFEVKDDGLFFAFVLEPTHNRWVEIKDTLPEDKSPNERFCELLGIKRDFSEPLEIYIMLANVSDVYRPAYEPDIRKRINVEFVKLLGNRNSSLITQPLNVWGYQTKSNYAELKRLLRYWDTNTNCCTRLGYTFDYAEINDTIKEGYTKKDDTTKKSLIGVPEVIIRNGSTVKIIKKISIEDFHTKGNCNKYFKKYLCSVCGYVYTPSEHDYITFEDLPEDWKCPLCGYEKDEFNID